MIKESKENTLKTTKEESKKKTRTSMQITNKIGQNRQTIKIIVPYQEKIINKKPNQEINNQKLDSQRSKHKISNSNTKIGALGKSYYQEGQVQSGFKANRRKKAERLVKSSQKFESDQFKMMLNINIAQSPMIDKRNKTKRLSNKISIPNFDYTTLHIEPQNEKRAVNLHKKQSASDLSFDIFKQNYLISSRENTEQIENFNQETLPCALGANQKIHLQSQLSYGLKSSINNINQNKINDKIHKQEQDQDEEECTTSEKDDNNFIFTEDIEILEGNIQQTQISIINEHQSNFKQQKNTEKSSFQSEINDLAQILSKDSNNLEKKKLQPFQQSIPIQEDKNIIQKINELESCLQIQNQKYSEISKIAKKFIKEMEQSSGTDNRNSFINLNVFKEIMTEFELNNGNSQILKSFEPNHENIFTKKIPLNKTELILINNFDRNVIQSKKNEFLVTDQTFSQKDLQNVIKQKNIDDQSDFKEISGEIMDQETKKVINSFSISKSRINNNFLPMNQKNILQNNQQLKNISDSTFEFSEIEDEMNENDKYLKQKHIALNILTMIKIQTQQRSALLKQLNDFQSMLQKNNQNKS